MTYTYSKLNLLEDPYTYMYTPFQGIDLFQSYLKNRMEVIQKEHDIIYQTTGIDQILLDKALRFLNNFVRNTVPKLGDMSCIFLKKNFPIEIDVNKDFENTLNELVKSLRKMTIADTVKTLELLYGLIAIQLNDETDKNIKIWIDRLVQRFEVTKKIYEIYPPGFRKGIGLNNSIRLYWLLALVLCLYYIKANGLKYLNTLLKLCDFLCSVPADMICMEVPVNGLTLVLETEVLCVFLLAKKKGISIEFN